MLHVISTDVLPKKLKHAFWRVARSKVFLLIQEALCGFRVME